MRFYFRVFFLVHCLFLSNTAVATSLFHSYITDLSPPYYCKLKLKSARGVSLDTKHNYQFSGICSIKIPVGNKWIYQNVWVELLGDWNGETNEAYETTTFSSNQGTVLVHLKCDDDPWITKAQCALVGYQNNTQYTNLGGVFNPRTGQYPPFEIITGQYPPLARNQAILKEAIALSILTATKEATAAHNAFTKLFGSDSTLNNLSDSKAVVQKRVTRVFKKPRFGNLRVDCCLKMNKECGKPAADRYCRSRGFKQSVNCRIDPSRCAPTFILGTQTVCTQPYCKGFDEVECAN